MRSPRVPLAVFGVTLAALVAAACPGLTGPDHNTPTSTVEIAGIIYATQTPPPGDQPIDPVSGVVVSTSLSAATATTDATGYFDLKTNAVLSSSCTPYTVTIAAPGHAAWSGTGNWGLMAVGQVFVLSQLMGSGNLMEGCP